VEERVAEAFCVRLAVDGEDFVLLVPEVLAVVAGDDQVGRAIGVHAWTAAW
jgi:hypothetical protein